MNTTVASDYTMHLLDTHRDAVRTEGLHFHIRDRRGAVVTDYHESHGKQVHLIVVPHDLTSFQHVHPVMDDTGTWAVDLAPLEPGHHRVFADVHPWTAATALTLEQDLVVAGSSEPRPLPPATRTVNAGPYQVTLHGSLVPAGPSTLTFTIAHAGRPVTNLDPYLGAYGHLVAIRAGDLAYAHVHPDGEPGDGRTAPGPSVTFHTEVPRDGLYRLFLDFQHHGTVHTAAFTVPVVETEAQPTTLMPAAHHAHH